MRFGVRGAWLPSSMINLNLSSPQFVASGRMEVTFGHAIAPLPDFVNYGTDPSRFERLLVTPQAGEAVQFSLEGGLLGSHLGARSPGLPVPDVRRLDGWVDVQVRVQAGEWRLAATGRLQTWQVLQPIGTPTRSVDFEPRLLGLLGASWTARSIRLTPALLVGVSRRASATSGPPSFEGANPPPGLTGPRIIVRDREDTAIYPGTESPPKFQAGGSLTWQPIDQLVLISALDVTTGRTFVFRDSSASIAEPVEVQATTVRGQVLAQFRW
ncbi:MAG: hypothetical protein ACO1OB_14565 [Archangium sp.]